MLIDTGATNTCMALDVAEELNLSPVGIKPSYGVGGLHHNKLFEAYLTITVADSFGQRTTVESFRQVAGVPDLNKVFNALGVQTAEADDFPKRLIGLLGREFLRHATLVYVVVGSSR
jgi:hypothetical protein